MARAWEQLRGFSLLIVCVCSPWGLAWPEALRAQDDAGAVIEFRYTPTARAQTAIWVEAEDGTFMGTVRLTDAVAFRGIGNRPGASEMNSGYRWPYGRREGVLPIWGTRRANAPGARAFRRVVFQSRIEGLASRTASDQSPDDYYCLSFTKSNSSRDALDAVSCASVFTSDKGRYITASDLAGPYAEPYESIGTFDDSMQAMPEVSLYPPRMDLTRCTASSCYDSADVDAFVSDARVVMPDIDAVTTATPPGDSEQSVLFSVPRTWPRGVYVAWLEINVEGDYAPGWAAADYRTPTTPTGKWDSWAMSYGYPYRGQPSVVFKAPFLLDAVGNAEFSTDAPAGRSSWDVWASDFGTLSPSSDIVDDPSGAPGSGADRLRRDADGHRLIVRTQVLSELPEPEDVVTDADGGVVVPGDPTDPSGAGVSGGGAGSTEGGQGGRAGRPVNSAGGDGANEPGGASDEDVTTGRVIEGTGGGTDGPVGAIYDLELRHHDDELRAHTWISFSFTAATSLQPVHSYEVRLATAPIVDDASFIRNGRQARNATDDSEGATLLMLPVDTRPGRTVDGSIGDLIAQTHYYVAVRATDSFNRHGPITVAEITTKRRVFATVTPCFIATAAYGTPLAAEVTVLREVRDRYLMPNAPGRALVAAYYAAGPRLSAVVREHRVLGDLVRAVLDPFVRVARRMLER